MPFFLVYGVIYGSSCDSRWHECGHGTAFRTGWMNDVIYQIASFMVMRNPVTWRWSHARHHTDTYIVGRDAEIAWMRPPQDADELPRLLRCASARIKSLRILLATRQASFRQMKRTIIPESEWGKTIFAARVHIAIYAATIADRPGDALLAAADADRPAAHLWQLAHGDDRPSAAWRAWPRMCSIID